MTPPKRLDAKRRPRPPPLKIDPKTSETFFFDSGSKHARLSPAHFLDYSTDQGSKSKVYIGCLSSATDKLWISRSSITTVISIISKPIDTSIKEFYVKRNITHIEYLKHDSDSTNIVSTFKRLESEHDIGSLLKQGNVLIHCFMGMSRAVAIAMALLIKYKGKTVDEAYAYIKMKRPIVDPNFTFMSQLYFFRKEIERIENKYLQQNESFKRLSLV